MSETLYGHHAVLEALRAGRRRFYRLVVAQGVKEREAMAEMLQLAQQKRIPMQRAERDALPGLDGEAKAQGVAAEVSPYPYADWEEIMAGALGGAEPPFLLLLDCLQDPQNLGTLLRTAEAVGVHGVAIPQHRAAAITPAVSSASAGAVEHLHIAQITNVAQTIAALKDKDIWVVGLEHAPQAKRYDEIDLNIPLALVVGSEGRGLSRLVRERCDWLIQLPMRGKVGSLNASAAGSIALYWAWRQRKSI